MNPPKRQHTGAIAAECAGTDAAKAASSAVSQRKSSGSRLGEAHVAYLDLAAQVARRRDNGQSVSPVYRVYLRDGSGNVVSGHTIAVDNDAQAIKVASVLCNACSELTEWYEVWKGEFLLVVSRAAAPVPSPAEVMQRVQQIVIEREPAAEGRREFDAIEEWQASTELPPRRGRVQ